MTWGKAARRCRRAGGVVAVAFKEEHRWASPLRTAASSARASSGRRPSTALSPLGARNRAARRSVSGEAAVAGENHNAAAAARMKKGDRLSFLVSFGL